MGLQRVAPIAAITTIAVSVLYLAVWGLLWRVVVTNPWPTALYLVPLNAFGCVLAAIGLWCAVNRSSPSITRAFASAVGLLALVVLLQYALRIEHGIEQLLFGEQARALLGGAYPGRPAPQAAMVFLFLALALWFAARPREARFDLADIAGAGAVVVSFTAVLGHLFRAEQLYGASSGLSLVDGLLQLVLALGALSLNPRGLMAAYGADDAGGAARRRLLPSVVLTPVLLGLVLFVAVNSGVDFSLGLALSVTANIVVFIVLIEWVSRLLTRIEDERSGVMRLRETKAKEEGKTDMLTGLLNRRGWDACMQHWEARCQQENLNACVVAIDLDGLKHVNDTQGHDKGDELLRRAGTALRTAARREDYLARLGGDEFAYLAVGCEPEHAEVVLKRLTGALAHAKVMASLGYAMRDLAGSLDAAYKEADQSMYAQKRARKAARAG